MSAREVIRQIQELPEGERLEVIEYVKQNIVSENGALVVRRMDLASAEAAAERVFSEHAELFHRLAQ